MQESSRGADHGSDLCFHVFVYAGKSLQAHSHLTDRVYVRWHALRLHKPRRVMELRAVDEGAVPASAPATSQLFVLPVAAHRWVSTDNTFWHARWDPSRQQRPLRQCLELKIKNPLPVPSRMKNSLLNTRRSMMRSKLCWKPISSALLRGPATMALSGRGSRLKALSTTWICLYHQRSALGPCVRR